MLLGNGFALNLPNPIFDIHLGCTFAQQSVLMNILLLGSGGREHALAWKMVQSHHCDQLFIAPGNAGTTEFGTNLDISISDFPEIKNACLALKINMLVVGPEEPLVKGIL